jgi:acetylcholinesterase
MAASPSKSKTASGGRGSTLLYVTIPVLVAAAVLYFPAALKTRLLGTNYEPVVSIKQGTIIGRTVDDGTFPKPIEQFLGIPFALPPVDELRFRPAQPVPSGNGTIYAYQMGPR